MNKDSRQSIQRFFVLFAVFAAVWACSAQGAVPEWQSRDVDIRISGGLRIVSISEPVESLGFQNVESAVVQELGGYPQPPLAGFSPLVAVATSNSRSYEEFDWEHVLRSSYIGSALHPPANENFVIGLFDSGSVLDLVAGSSATTLGLAGQYLTSNEFLLGGVGGTINGVLSQPVGIFAAGLGAIGSNGQLDLNQLVGHTNVSAVVAPSITCGDSEEVITAIVGTPMLSFFTTVIRNDTLQVVTVNDETIVSPDVKLFESFEPPVLEYPRAIAMEFGGPVPVTTASYYGDFGDLITPITPTLLSMTGLSIPFGGAFFADIGALEGEPGPTNPMQTIRVLVDTGAQSSIISPTVAASLSLPVEPDFTVDVCGIGGTVEGVPGYYIDYVKINAWGGALEFSSAPVVVIDLQSPEGGSLDGVLGMNFFWNRNIVFDPSLTLSSILHVSDPVPFAYGDFDGSGGVNLVDFGIFSAAWLTESGDAQWNPLCDVFIDNVIDIRDLDAFVERWLEGY